MVDGILTIRLEEFVKHIILSVKKNVIKKNQ